MKCVTKRDPRERVGVLCKKNGKYDVVEYSELSEELAQKKAPGGNYLHFELANILVFVLSSKKLLELCKGEEGLNKLYHVAHKKVEVWSREANKSITPPSNNAYKFELFIHNFLPFCQKGKFGALKVQREDEFAPVKNSEPPDGSTGTDSPSSARRLLLNQHNRWVQKRCPRGKNEIFENIKTEVDFLLSYEGEGMEFEAQCKTIGDALRQFKS